MTLVEAVPLIFFAMLLLIGGGLAYLFFFRTPSAQVDAVMLARLDELYADTDLSRQRASLIMRGTEPAKGQLRGVVLSKEGYERLDPRRLVLTLSVDTYAQTAVNWRKTWQVDAYWQVQPQMEAAFNAHLQAMLDEGWTLEMDLPFSEIDRLVYLSR